MKVPLARLAFTCAGHQGDVANIGVIARQGKYYPLLQRELTPQRVAAFLADRVQGPVARYELPNLAALNFVLHAALDGGATISLRLDAQGKALAAALLRMEIEVPPQDLAE